MVYHLFKIKFTYNYQLHQICRTFLGRKDRTLFENLTLQLQLQKSHDKVHIKSLVLQNVNMLRVNKHK